MFIALTIAFNRGVTALHKKKLSRQLETLFVENITVSNILLNNFSTDLEENY